MRVVLACPYAWDLPGGVQVHVRELAGHLRGRGHDVLVVAPAVADAPGARVVGGVIRVRYQGTVAPICPSPASVPRVARALAGFRPQVVHAHEPLVPSTGMFAALRSPAPVVATFHAHTERSLLLTAAAPLLRPVWRRLAVRIAVSEAAASFVRSRFGDGIRVVPNGCDVDAFANARPAPDLPVGRRVVWVGRLDPQKGFLVALRAFEALAASLPDLSLVVVGDGPQRRAVEGLSVDTRPRLVLAGAVDHDRVPSYLAGADAFVAPALGQESFGMVLVEAMAAGVPVVASDIAGYREVVSDGVDGLLVTPGDEEALASALRRVLEDAGLSSRLRVGGRRRAQRYRWETVADEVERAYAAAAGNAA